MTFEISLSSLSPGVSINLSFPLNWLISSIIWFSKFSGLIISLALFSSLLFIFSKLIIYSVHLVVQISACFCSLANKDPDILFINVLLPQREPPKIKISKHVVAVARLNFPKFR